ncbi:hypothetical protein D3C84_1184490 [compost metagenome]
MQEIKKGFGFGLWIEQKLFVSDHMGVGVGGEIPLQELNPFVQVTLVTFQLLVTALYPGFQH